MAQSTSWEWKWVRFPPGKDWGQQTETVSLVGRARDPSHWSLCFWVFMTFLQNKVLGRSSE